LKPVKNFKLKQKKYFRPRFILLFLLVSLILTTGITIWNFDKLSAFMPSKYVGFFSKVNDFIFGKVQIIEIKGNKIVSRNEILDHAYKNKVFEDDINLIKHEIEIIKSLEKHPLIEYVFIKRFLPNKMVIYIKEKGLIIRVWDSNLKKFFSVTNQGEIIDFYDPKIPLPLVIDNFKTKDILNIYNLIFEYNLQQYVTDINSFFDYRFDLVLNRVTIVNLPELNTEKSIKILLDLIENQDILSKNIKQIDLRVENKIFIKYFKKNEDQIYSPISSFKILTW
jgi:cell division septal protein FtsQ